MSQFSDAPTGGCSSFEDSFSAELIERLVRADIQECPEEFVVNSLESASAVSRARAQILLFKTSADTEPVRSAVNLASFALFSRGYRLLPSFKNDEFRHTATLAYLDEDTVSHPFQIGITPLHRDYYPSPDTPQRFVALEQHEGVTDLYVAGSSHNYDYSLGLQEKHQLSLLETVALTEAGLVDPAILDTVVMRTRLTPGDVAVFSLSSFHCTRTIKAPRYARGHVFEWSSGE